MEPSDSGNGDGLPGSDIERVLERGEDMNGKPLNLKEKRAEGVEAPCLEGAHLEGAKLTGAHLQGADLYHAHLEGACLIDAHLEGANLGEAHLEGARLRKAHLEGAYLQGAYLQGACLTGAHLEGADLQGAQFGPLNREDVINYFHWLHKGKSTDLSGAFLSPLKVGVCRLMPHRLMSGPQVNEELPVGTPADLTNADLAQVYLAGADLTQAVVAGAKFWTFTPPKRRAAGPSAAWRVRAVSGEMGSRLWYQALASGDDDDDDESEDDDDDDAADDEDERGPSPSAALASRLKAFAASAARVLLVLDERVQALLNEHLDASAAGALVAGDKLLTLQRRDGHVELRDLESFVEKHIITPIFDTLLPKLLKELGRALGLEMVGGRRLSLHGPAQVHPSPAPMPAASSASSGDGSQGSAVADVEAGGSSAGGLELSLLELSRRAAGGLELLDTTQRQDVQQMLDELDQLLLHNLREPVTAAIKLAIEPVVGLLAVKPLKQTAFGRVVDDAVRARKAERSAVEAARKITPLAKGITKPEAEPTEADSSLLRRIRVLDSLLAAGPPKTTRWRTFDAKALRATDAAAHELIKHTRTALEGGLQKQVRLVLFGGARSLMSATGNGKGSLSKLAKWLDKVEEYAGAVLDQVYDQNVDGLGSERELVWRYARSLLPTFVPPYLPYLSYLSYLTYLSYLSYLSYFPTGTRAAGLAACARS